MKCISRCVSEGNFTNHGPYVTECEELLTHYLGDIYYTAIYGSSAVGTAVGIWLAGGLENYEGSYSAAELKSLVELLNGFRANPHREHGSSRLRIYKHIGLEDLKKTISSEVQIHVVNGIFNTTSESQYHSELDYSILVLTDHVKYKEAVSMRSSYGVGDSATDVIATLNGRPSELIGQSILNILKP